MHMCITHYCAMFLRITLCVYVCGCVCLVGTFVVCVSVCMRCGLLFFFCAGCVSMYLLALLELLRPVYFVRGRSDDLHDWAYVRHVCTHTGDLQVQNRPHIIYAILYVFSAHPKITAHKLHKHTVIGCEKTAVTSLRIRKRQQHDLANVCLCKTKWRRDDPVGCNNTYQKPAHTSKHTDTHTHTQSHQTHATVMSCF